MPTPEPMNVFNCFKTDPDRASLSHAHYEPLAMDSQPEERNELLVLTTAGQAVNLSLTDSGLSLLQRSKSESVVILLGIGRRAERWAGGVLAGVHLRRCRARIWRGRLGAGLTTLSTI